MADEPSLPTLLRPAAADTSTFLNNPARKRVRLSSPPVSSDPAIFSSDDDPSLENYTQERRKKIYVGSWFHQRRLSTSTNTSDTPPSDTNRSNNLHKRNKRPFERQFDSGVFMGSDGTDIEESEDNPSSLAPVLLPVRPSRTQQTSSMDWNYNAEKFAREKIQWCLEHGNETIDLSALGLKTISSETFLPLATFTRVASIARNVPARIEPSLKIFLSRNDLTTLPAQLFNLENLVVLGLRGNDFVELPQSIRLLTRLEELGLGQNKLRFLPYNILDLFSEDSRLVTFSIHPNPFLEPKFPGAAAKKENSTPFPPPQSRYPFNPDNPARRRFAMSPTINDEDAPENDLKWTTTYQASSEVRFLDRYGELVKGPEFPTDGWKYGARISIPVASKNYVPRPPIPRGSAYSRAPSLTEVSLLCASNLSFTYDGTIDSYNRTKVPIPDHLGSLIDGVRENVLEGGARCTICERFYMVARTEWIEWYEFAKVPSQSGPATSTASPLGRIESRDAIESFVPLIRRGCSWLCVPEGNGH